MSRDFILIFSGGMVSLITTIVVLFVADYIYRRGQVNQPKIESADPVQVPKPEPVRPVESHKPETVQPVESKSEPLHPPESKFSQAKEDKPA